MPQQLPEARRAQLDDIVGRMEAANESPDEIKAVIDDFKQKYATDEQPKGPTGGYGALAGIGNTIQDLGVGALKGAGSTVKTIADAARAHLPGVAKLDQLMTPIQVGSTLQPSNTAQSVGRVAEQAGEFLLPSRYASAAAGLAAPKMALQLGRAAPLVAEGLAQGAAAVPMAMAQGGDPKMAALTGAVAPAVAQGVGTLAKAAGRNVVTKFAAPAAAQLRKMAGGRGADKAGDVVDTILERRLWGPGTARRQIGEQEAIIDDLLAGKSGDAVTNAHELVPERLANLETRFAESATPEAGLDAVAAERAKLLGPRAPLAHDVQTGVRQEATGILDAAGKPITRDVPVMGRALRPNITARDAVKTARATARDRPGLAFGEQKIPLPTQASKATELALRDAARNRVGALDQPMTLTSKLINAEEALKHSQSGASVLDAVGGAKGLILKLLRTGAVAGGVGTHAAGDPMQRLLENAILRGLLSGQTGDGGQ